MSEIKAPRPISDLEHREIVERERAEREARLRDPMGWLSLVGLYRLEPGRRRFGASETNDIVLRAEQGSVPGVAGELVVAGEQVVVHPAAPDLMIERQPVASDLELVDDEADAPSVLELASLRLALIRRGGRPWLRVWDVAAPALRAFQGLRYFDIDPRWRITGRLIRADPGATIRVPDVLGNIAEEPTPGMVEFEVDGQTYRLHALEAMPGHLALMFGDATNGDATYGGGRYLISGPVGPEDTVGLDFNLAYSPPCIFTPYATCSLPAPDDRLPIRVEAGEMGFTIGRTEPT